MNPSDALQRAKADLVDLNRKINLMDAEITRLTMTKNGVVNDRNQVAAFIKLWDKYTGEPTVVASAAIIVGDAAFVGTSAPAAIESPPATPTSPETAPKEAKAVPVRRGKRGKKKKAHRVPRKPTDTPTVPEMILASLKAAKAKGQPGLPPKGMTEFIASKWWPHVRGDSIAPIAWRMHRDKLLEKDGEIYKLPEAA